ncbi:hypothetical protein ARSEF1564_010129 [Beauveria bassiana]
MPGTKLTIARIKHICSRAAVHADFRCDVLRIVASTYESQPKTPKKRKLRTPETWKHFRLPQADEETHQSSQRLWYCQKCCNPSWRTVSTTSAKRHMRNTHGIAIEEEERPAKKALQQSLEVAFMHAEQKSREIATRSEESILRNTIQLDAFDEAQIQLITRRRLPLNCVSWPEYQALLCAVNPRAEEVLIQSGTTVFAHNERSYLLHREAIKSQLQAAKSKVHFSIDLWSSPHRKAFLGICGQWVDDNYELSDNATSNDTCMSALSMSLASEFGVEFHPTERRIRCGGHIINLCLQAFLFASSKEALCAAIEEADRSMDTTAVEYLQEQLRQRAGKGRR